jgi:hypothetical protein
VKGVFEYDKTLLDRYEEIKGVLDYGSEAIPASQVRDEWVKYVELCLEPAGEYSWINLQSIFQY